MDTLGIPIASRLLLEFLNRFGGIGSLSIPIST